MKYGHGEAADRLLERLAEEIAENPGFRNISVFTIEDGTPFGATFVRGLNDSDRNDGYGITKAHVTLAKRELGKLGVKLPFDEVDGLLHHAEAHRTGFCDCEDVTSEDNETTQQKLAGMNSTARNRAWRARAAKAGYCARGGFAHGLAKRGTICAKCLEYLVARRREQRQRARQARETA